MKKIFILFFIFLIQNRLTAQQYYGATQEEFGQNRIQTKNFVWKTMASNNFEFNFYRGGDKHAKIAAEIAEQEYNRITDIIGYTPYTVMKVYVYNSPKDLKQSNIGLNVPIHHEGGLMNVSKSRIEIPYQGSDSLFKKEVIKEISNLFVYDMLYGGTLKDVLQSSILLTVPEWYTKGIAAFIAEGSNKSQFNTFKQAINGAKSKRLVQLKDEEATLIGQSIWFYISQKYGPDNIANILNLTRIIRNEEASITSTVGVPFSKFLLGWKAFYENPQIPEIESTNINESQVKEEEKPKLNLPDGQIDTDHYEFNQKSLDNYAKTDEDSTKKKSSVLGRLLTPVSSKEKIKIEPIKAYQNLFIANDLETEIYNDPIRGFSAGGTLSMNDLLENHKLKLKGLTNLNLRNHDISLSYENLSNRMDWGVDYTRRSIDIEIIDDRNSFILRPLNINLPGGDIYQLNRRLLSNQIEGHVNYPLSNHLRVSGNLGFLETKDINQYFRSLENDILSTKFITSGAEIVFDNTVLDGSIAQLGTKAKLSLQKSSALNESLQSFNSISLDIRHYQKIIKGLQFATRLTYIRNFGNRPKDTFLGGMENTLNRDAYIKPGRAINEPTDLRDVLFYNFPGNLRGFQFAKLNGQNATLLNAELRFSLESFFSRTSLTSNFIRNLNVVGFADLGSAWDGNSWPLNKENSLNTTIIEQNIFYAKVTNFQNPFIMGTGFGLRTQIFGYFVKADYAWGIQDRQVNKPILYLSLGHDF